MNALTRLEMCPDWPARMTAPVAALFMGVSETKFLEQYGEIGVRDGGNKFWAKVQLERIVAEQFDLGTVSHAAPVSAESEYDRWKAGRGR